MAVVSGFVILGATRLIPPKITCSCCKLEVHTRVVGNGIGFYTMDMEK